MINQISFSGTANVYSGSLQDKKVIVESGKRDQVNRTIETHLPRFLDIRIDGKPISTDEKFKVVSEGHYFRADGTKGRLVNIIPDRALVCHDRLTVDDDLLDLAE